MNFLPSTNKLRYDGPDGDSSIGRYRRHQQGKRRRSTSPARATVEAESNSDWTDAESRDPGNAGAARARRHSQPVEESADDEDDDLSSAFETAEEPARESGWKRADRIVSGSLAGEAASRSELLMKERSISEEALRSSLSTLLMLRPGGSAPPVLSRSNTDSIASLSSSPASNVTARGRSALDRRSTIMPLSYQASTSARVPTPISRDEGGWADVQISSASSFEDLGLDFDSEQDDVESSSQQNKLVYNKPEIVGKRRRAAKKGSIRRQAGLTASPSKSGFVSEPDTSQARPDSDFLELLLAARTFASMRSSQGQSLDVLADQTKPTQSSASSRDASPAGLASMSSSTNFVLSSSDSPPSRDLASSREMARSGSNTRSPSPLPLEMEARLRLSREETITGMPYGGEPEKPQSWWDWLVGAIGPVGIGITIVGLVGLGFAVASRSSLFRKPMLRSTVVYTM